MLLKTTRFGEIEIQDNEIIDFPEGLIGFSNNKKFVILDHRQKVSSFKWFQSVDDSALAFIIINPNQFSVNYEPELLKADLDTLRLSSINQAEVYTTVIVPEDPVKMSANLLGPIIINRQERLGKQIILSTVKYTTSHFIVEEIIHNSSGVKNASSVAQTK